MLTSVHTFTVSRRCCPCCLVAQAQMTGFGTFTGTLVALVNAAITWSRMDMHWLWHQLGEAHPSLVSRQPAVLSSPPDNGALLQAMGMSNGCTFSVKQSIVNVWKATRSVICLLYHKINWQAKHHWVKVSWKWNQPKKMVHCGDNFNALNSMASWQGTRNTSLKQRSL